MFDGMNTSCLVTIETFRDVLTIPAAALCDEGGTRLVYTALSRDKSELSNPVPIEPGFSDGETLEILSCLSEGDTVWYKTFDTPEYSVPKSRSSGGLGSLLGGAESETAHVKPEQFNNPQETVPSSSPAGFIFISQSVHLDFKLISSSGATLSAQ
jgi:hypothetical protein